MRRFLIALQFLSGIPVPHDFKASPEDLGGCMAYFPAVGLVLGGMLAGLRPMLRGFLPEATVNLACVVGLVVLTRGLHLDGLADTADGFLSHRGRERTLAIMKDSRIGTMGVLAVVGVLALKFHFLSMVAQSAKGWALIGVLAASRWGVVLQAWGLPYARCGEGLGKAFAEHAGPREVLAATVVAVGALLAGFRAKGLAILVCCGVFSLLFAWYVKRRIGGCTGDTLGASVELGEVVTLLSVYVVCIPA